MPPPGESPDAGSNPIVELIDMFCECIPMPDAGLPKADGETPSIRPIGLNPLMPLTLVPALTIESGLIGLLVAGDVKLVFLECCIP